MHNKSSNRSFGVLFFIVFLIIGLWPLLNENQIRIWSISAGIIFLVFGLLNSNLLSPLNKLWVKFGEILGLIIAPIIMFFVYFIFLTPVSLIVRIFGKDLLDIKFNKKSETYWINRKKNLGSMKKQF